MNPITKYSLVTATLVGSSTLAHAIVNFDAIGAVDNAAVPLAQTFSDGGVDFQFGVDTDGLTGGISRNSTAFFEAVGEVDSLNGFKNDQLNAFDTEAAGFTPSTTEPGLGEFFLRTEPVGSGGNSLDGPGLFVIEYTAGTAVEASGQIWDIDGNIPTPGTEQYVVTAYDVDLNALDSDTSPLGTINTAGSLDGLPWQFSIASTSNPIKFITIDFIGSKTTNIGLAFDNFNAVGGQIPEPGTYALLAGLFALSSIMLRRRK